MFETLFYIRFFTTEEFNLLSKKSKLLIFKRQFSLRLKNGSSKKISFKTFETDDEALVNYIDVYADERCLVESVAKKVRN